MPLPTVVSDGQFFFSVDLCRLLILNAVSVFEKRICPRDRVENCVCGVSIVAPRESNVSGFEATAHCFEKSFVIGGTLLHRDVDTITGESVSHLCD